MRASSFLRAVVRPMTLLCLVALVTPIHAPAAAGPLEQGVELGPATRYFAIPDIGLVPPDGFPSPWRSSEDGKGNGKGKGKGDGGETSGGTGSSEPIQEHCWQWRPAELEFLDRINNARVSHGRKPVRLDRELSRVARKHTWEMVEQQKLFHTPEETLRKRVTNWLILGENLGRGYSPESLHKAFMASAPHRDNVLFRPFTFVGIGTMRDEHDNLWVTILLEAYNDPGTTLDVPAWC